MSEFELTKSLCDMTHYYIIEQYFPYFNLNRG